MLLTRTLSALAVMTAAWLVPLPTHACTTFCWQGPGTLVFGKNYDWDVADGLVVVNPRGVSKQALTPEHPARWTAKFGSVTFNQYGREFPCGGMNERGLVVELMWLDETRYPDADARMALPTLQWIQYQLDTSATVAEVIASDRVVRIVDAAMVPLHFLVADECGVVATIEFIDGHLVAHRGRDLPFPVLTNDTYASSAEYARRSNGPYNLSSLDRFAQAARRVTARPARAGAAGVADAFTLLGDVAQNAQTQWSIVYAIGERRVHFRTHLQRGVRSLDLDDLTFGCDRPVVCVPIDARYTGDLASHLVPCTYDVNLELVRAAFDQTDFLKDVPSAEQEELARYPDAGTCKR